MTTLLQMIEQARLLGGGRCVHKWTSVGGRRCPRAPDDYEPGCSQTVYVCTLCGEPDYGEPGGPGHDDCFVLGPCDLSCEPGVLFEAPPESP